MGFMFTNVKVFLHYEIWQAKMFTENSGGGSRIPSH